MHPLSGACIIKEKGGDVMYKNLLPIGSVVLLKGGEKRLMICGRIQTRAGSDKVYDYSAPLPVSRGHHRPGGHVLL